MIKSKYRTTPVVQRLSTSLSLVERILNKRLSDLVRSCGVTVEEARVLYLISDGEGHPMSEIAHTAVLPNPSVTRLVDRLVADGLVYRKADDRDRRRVLVYATARGSQTATRISARMGVLEDELVRMIGEPEADMLVEQLDELAGLLDS